MHLKGIFMKSEKIKVGNATLSILKATTTSFTVCILCWSVFWLIPIWQSKGLVSALSVASAIWVSLGICLCMSICGFVCFSEALVKTASLPVRCLAFSVAGYTIITTWVFGSGWCPMNGFVTFTVICVLALLFACTAVLIQSKKANARLDEQLNRYKQK